MRVTKNISLNNIVKFEIRFRNLLCSINVYYIHVYYIFREIQNFYDQNFGSNFIYIIINLHFFLIGTQSHLLLQ